MRSQSLCLLSASNQDSGIDVIFGAEFNFRVQIPDFRRAHHYKVSKNLFTGSQHQKVLFTGSSLTGKEGQKIFGACLVVSEQLTATRTCFEGMPFGRLPPHRIVRRKAHSRRRRPALIWSHAFKTNNKNIV